MNEVMVLHETRHRLRLDAGNHADLDALVASLTAIPGVRSVRANATLRCVVIRFDGCAQTREAVLARLDSPLQHPRPQRLRTRQKTSNWTVAIPTVLALAVPMAPRDWRPSLALSVVGARVLTQTELLLSDKSAVLLEAVSLTSLALSGQPLVVSTSVLLRLLSERLAIRLVREADNLLDHLLPSEAAQYTVLRDHHIDPNWAARPLESLRVGDRVRLGTGDVVPIDGCVVSGTALLTPAVHEVQPRQVSPGVHVSAGERLLKGTLELHAEANSASSRLSRLRAQVQHAIGSRDPFGRLTPEIERGLSLPLTASALVLGLTGDTARAAAMMQADPNQGLDLALPLAREAALYALARHGLLTAGLDTIERLAVARTLVLQDTGVLTCGRWTIADISVESGCDSAQVCRWLATLADTPLEALDKASFPDNLVRQWVRHGALLRTGEQELHLASPQRLQKIWGAKLNDQLTAVSSKSIQRQLVVVAAGLVVARVVLSSDFRPGTLDRLKELAALGFSRVAVFVDIDGNVLDPKGAPVAESWQGLDRISDDPANRSDWLSDAVSDGSPLVMVHTVLRDLVPSGSLSLTPMDADAGSHGVLLGDPLVSLVAARQVAQIVHQRLRLQQDVAAIGNAALMTSAALRWLPPMGTALLHHGLALLLLLDSFRIESIRKHQQKT